MKERRDLAVFTIVQDEPEFIHAWINHYRRHVEEPRDLYVLTHAPTRPDGQPMSASDMPAWSRAVGLVTSHHNVTTFPVHHASAFDHQWLVDTVSRFQSLLLQSYEWVLFAEADEFVLPTPGPMPPDATLRELVRGLGAPRPPAVRATGFEIVQQEGETPVLPTLYEGGTNFRLTAAQLIEGCGLWYSSIRYSKPLLASVPMRWTVGFHTVQGPGADIDPSPLLTLVHLHKADFALALGRSRRSRARKWSAADLENRAGWQNRIDDTADLRAYWKTDIDTEQPMAVGRLHPIAPAIRRALGAEG